MSQLLSQLKSRAKHALTQHQQGQHPNIFLFSTPRSGSTWLAEVIATQPGFRIVNEPFNLRKSVVREKLGITEWGQLLERDTERLIRDYLELFIDGGDSDWRFYRESPFSDLWRSRTDRILFKILFAGENDFDWFGECFNGDVVFFVRHPIPVTYSREEFPRTSALLESSYSENFSADQLRVARHVAKNGSGFERGVLDWCLQNAPPLWKNCSSWVFLTYEEFVTDPVFTVETLASRLDLLDPEAMLERLTRPSKSISKSKPATRERLRQLGERTEEDKRWLTGRWLERVSREDQESTQNLLDVFQIRLYSAFQPHPVGRPHSKDPSVS